MKKFPVVELFGPTIQGEGALIGKRSHFIRFGGCGYRCSWCDSMHAVDPQQIKANATMMTAEEISFKLDVLNPSPWVTLSGGDPVMWDLSTFVESPFGSRYRIAVETQGQHFRPWLKYTSMVTISPKGPSSGMYEKTDWDVLDQYHEEIFSSYQLSPEMVFKIVIFDREDLEFAKEVIERYPSVPMYLSVGTPINETQSTNDVYLDICEGLYQISETILADPAFRNATLLPQQHVLTWGHKKGV